MSVERWLLYNRGSALIALGLINVAVFAFAHVGLSETPAPDPVQEDLKLVGEHSIELIDPTAIAEGARFPRSQPVMHRSCREWGPIFEATALESLLAALNQRGLEPQLTDTEVQVDRRFAVQVGPIEDLAKLKSIEARLDDGGIDRMRFGSDANFFVSVGVFSSRDRALKQRDRLLNLGLNSTLKISGKPATAKLVRAYLPLDERFPDHPGSPCPEIAQGR